jgi:hypothetical protein
MKKMAFLFTALGRVLVIALFGVACLHAAMLDHWQYRNPTPTGEAVDLYGTLFDGPRYVALGDAGSVLLSSDDKTWQVMQTPTDASLQRLCKGVDCYIAVGTVGTILRSVDGTNWIKQVSPWAGDFYNVAYGNGVFVATGFNGTISTSEDGITWKNRPSLTSGNIYGLAFGNGVFVATAPNNTYVARSSDGTNWTTTALVGAKTGAGFSFGNGIFVLSGTDTVQNKNAFLTSTDGLTWATQQEPPRDITLAGVGFANGLFYAPGLSNNVTILRTSTNGTNWATRTYVGSKGLVGAEGTNYVMIGNAALYLSGNSFSWVNRTASVPELQSIANVAAGNRAFVVVGSSATIYSSPTGEVWTKRFAGISGDLYNVGFGGDRFVAIGPEGKMTTSADGSAWSATASGVTNNLWGIAWADGEFVVTGESGTILSSTDGLTWAETNAPTSNAILSVCRGNGVWLAIDNSGFVYTSSDAMVWAKGAQVPAGPHTCAFGAGVFVAAGNPPSIYSSPDGVKWTARASGSSQSVSRIAYLRDTFIAVGQFGTLLTSTNGTNWSKRLSGTTYSLGGVAYQPDSLVVAGANGRILQSGAVLALETPLVSGSTLSMTVSAHPDSDIKVERSPDLINWTELGTVAAGSGRASISDSSGAGTGKAFYRTVVTSPTP